MKQQMTISRRKITNLVKLEAFFDNSKSFFVFSALDSCKFFNSARKFLESSLKELYSIEERFM